MPSGCIIGATLVSWKGGDLLQSCEASAVKVAQWKRLIGWLLCPQSPLVQGLPLRKALLWTCFWQVHGSAMFSMYSISSFDMFDRHSFRSSSVPTGSYLWRQVSLILLALCDVCGRGSRVQRCPDHLRRSAAPFKLREVWLSFSCTRALPGKPDTLNVLLSKTQHAYVQAESCRHDSTHDHTINTQYMPNSSNGLVWKLQDHVGFTPKFRSNIGALVSWACLARAFLN